MTTFEEQARKIWSGIFSGRQKKSQDLEELAQALASADRAGYELGFQSGRNRGLEEAALQITSGWAPTAPAEFQILAQRIRNLKVKL